MYLSNLVVVLSFPIGGPIYLYRFSSADAEEEAGYLEHLRLTTSTSNLQSGHLYGGYRLIYQLEPEVVGVSIPRNTL